MLENQVNDLQSSATWYYECRNFNAYYIHKIIVGVRHALSKTERSTRLSSSHARWPVGRQQDSCRLGPNQCSDKEKPKNTNSKKERFD